MIKLIIDWSSYSAWTIGVGTTALDIMGIKDIAGIPTDFGIFSYILAGTFVLSTLVKTTNLILDGIETREGKRQDNRAKEIANQIQEQELYSDMIKEIEDEKNR
jgi:hypothetical protein